MGHSWSGRDRNAPWALTTHKSRSLADSTLRSPPTSWHQFPIGQDSCPLPPGPPARGCRGDQRENHASSALPSEVRSLAADWHWACLCPCHPLVASRGIVVIPGCQMPAAAPRSVGGRTFSHALSGGVRSARAFVGVVGVPRPRSILRGVTGGGGGRASHRWADAQPFGGREHRCVQPWLCWSSCCW